MKSFSVEQWQVICSYTTEDSDTFPQVLIFRSPSGRGRGPLRPFTIHDEVSVGPILSWRVMSRRDIFDIHSFILSSYIFFCPPLWWCLLGLRGCYVCPHWGNNWGVSTPPSLIFSILASRAIVTWMLWQQPITLPFDLRPFPKEGSLVSFSKAD